ncbi:hypothetical protein JOF53_003432 [Crossiella equi]|uniref:DUF3558 domain-containing protein n=1 Tax=Crossiella equi TaxID=130796 RepID=A0ABS5ADA4_9PSEU|nr:hypothetical protein [Crossiella equi]MBP2474560.1 hypothetical protein [Crossiella equi]
MRASRELLTALVPLAVAGVVLAGCMNVIPGTAELPDNVALGTTRGTATATPTGIQGPPPSVLPQTLSSVPLVTGVVADECLLSAEEFTAMIDQPTRTGRNGVVELEGQGPARSCYYDEADGDRYSGWINIYGSAGPTTTDLVKRINKNVQISRDLPGVGLAAVYHPAAQILDGGTIYVATEKYLVEIRLKRVIGDDQKLVTAARQALVRLPA